MTAPRPALSAFLWLAYLLPVLLTLAVVTPPWQNPDEPLHMARAVQVAHGGLLGWRLWGTAGGYSDPALYAAYQPVRHAAMRPRARLSRADLTASAAVGFSPATSYVAFPNTAQYPPFFYVPDAAAYWVGRAAGLSVDRTCLLARAANAILFAAAAAAALGLARRARPLLAAVTVLPCTLSLACSASQDSLLFAATLLAVALLDRIAAEARAATRAEALAVAALLAAIAMARPPYVFLLLLLVGLAPRVSRRTLALPAAAAALVLAWCALVVLHSAVPLGHADPAAQLAFLAAHPAALPQIIGATARNYLADYWEQLIGVLGWTDTVLPRAYTAAASLVLLLAAAASAAGPGRRPGLAATAIGLAAAASAAGPGRRPGLAATAIGLAAAAIFVVQYFAWTWPGQLVITGVLGRYFVPLAMAASLALPARTGAARLRPAATAATVALACVTPAVMIHTLVFRYYVP